MLIYMASYVRDKYHTNQTNGADGRKTKPTGRTDETTETRHETSTDLVNVYFPDQDVEDKYSHDPLLTTET
jgi:hypothetical protein